MTDYNDRVADNLGLVHACARKFNGRGVEYEDLYSAGCVGLVKAAKNFDESLGYRFSTYAVPVILGEIKRVFRDGGAVKVSRSLKELAVRVSRLSAEYSRENGEEITVSLLAQKLGITPEMAAEAIGAARMPLSLTQSDEEDDGSQLDIAVESDEERLTERMSLHQAISSLEYPDSEIIRLRYFYNKTQTQTAEVLSMTQVQISRREKKILMSLREKMTV